VTGIMRLVLLSTLTHSSTVPMLSVFHRTQHALLESTRIADGP